jgi:hypothetical protein
MRAAQTRIMTHRAAWGAKGDQLDICAERLTCLLLDAPNAPDTPAPGIPPAKG